MISLFSHLPAPVFAYIDPGTGSMAFQALIAIMVSIGVFYRQIKLKIQMMFRGTKPPELTGTQPPADPPAEPPAAS